MLCSWKIPHMRRMDNMLWTPPLSTISLINRHECKYLPQRVALSIPTNLPHSTVRRLFLNKQSNINLMRYRHNIDQPLQIHRQFSTCNSVHVSKCRPPQQKDITNNLTFYCTLQVLDIGQIIIRGLNAVLCRRSGNDMIGETVSRLHCITSVGAQGVEKPSAFALIL